MLLSLFQYNLTTFTFNFGREMYPWSETPLYLDTVMHIWAHGVYFFSHKAYFWDKHPCSIFHSFQRIWKLDTVGSLLADFYISILTDILPFCHFLRGTFYQFLVIFCNIFWGIGNLHLEKSTICLPFSERKLIFFFFINNSLTFVLIMKYLRSDFSYILTKHSPSGSISYDLNIGTNISCCFFWLFYLFDSHILFHGSGNYSKYIDT